MYVIHEIIEVHDSFFLLLIATVAMVSASKMAISLSHKLLMNRHYGNHKILQILRISLNWSLNLNQLDNPG